MLRLTSTALGAAALLLDGGAGSLPKSPEAPLKEMDAGPGLACPDTNLARSLSLGYWYNVWGQMQCSHAFQEESFEMVVRDVDSQPGQCDVTFYRPAGDLQVRIIATKKQIISAQMRPPELRGKSGWSKVDRRVCRLSSTAGAAPLVVSMPTKLVEFAFKALYSTRQRFQLVQRVCGSPLTLVSSQGLNGQIEAIDRTVVRTFFIEVLEGANLAVIPVQVRVAEFSQVNPLTNRTETAYRFLSSTPSACQISAKIPFEAFGCTSVSGGPNGGAGWLRRLHSPRGRFMEVLDGAAAENMTRRLSASVVESMPDIVADLRHTDLPSAERQDVDAQQDRKLLAPNSQSLQQLPTYDLRQLFPRCGLAPRAMGQCSASYVFAAVGAFEKQLCKLTKGSISVSFSKQHILDCAWTARGCHGGSVFDAHSAMLRAGALVTESCVPYTSGKKLGDDSASLDDSPPLGSCPSVGSDCSRRFAARLPSPAEMTYQTRLSSSLPGVAATNILVGETGMQAGILIYGAIVATFALYSDFVSYKGGIFSGQQVDETYRLGNHAVQLIGWGVDTAGSKYWIAENSWGASWGENQYLQPCSVTDCQGPFCQSSKNFKAADCSDSAIWRDEFGNGCDWYTLNDLGCKLHPDSGQIQNCPRVCGHCPALAPQTGEICGYFRIARGQNTLGIEAFAAHTYVAGHSPAEDAVATLAGTCGDDPSWKDYLNKGCAWYGVQDPGCMKLQDVGQRVFCRQTCRTCPKDLARVRTPASVAEDSTSPLSAWPALWLLPLCSLAARSP